MTDPTRKNLDFSVALVALKQGARLKRAGWNGKDQFVFLVPGSTFPQSAARYPLDAFFSPGEEITYEPHVDIKNQQGTIVPWLVSQGDLLANDWEEVE